MKQERFRIKPTNEMFELKPFDKVLVRNKDEYKWRCDLYSHEVPSGHMCISGIYSQCIPYTEEIKHLLGTNNDHQKPEPKEYHVWTSGTFNEWFTKTEFENFIKTAVINNKDIKDFHVLYVKHID